MQQEAAHEFIRTEGHDLVAGAPLRAVVLPAEGHAPFVQRDEPLVGDGDAMGIAREIREYRLGSRERALRIPPPPTRAWRREPLCEDGRIGERVVLAEEA